MAAGDELVEWVDEDGSVIEIVTRSRMRDEHLRHRCVYIVVRSQPNPDSDPDPGDDGEWVDSILIHKRAEWKDVAPGEWDVAFGGVCDPGESWEQAARRELLEEAGIAVDEMVDHGEVRYEAPGVALIGRFYSCHSDGPFAFNDGEVVAAEWVAVADLPAVLNERIVVEDSDSVVLPKVIAWAEGGGLGDN